MFRYANRTFFERKCPTLFAIVTAMFITAAAFSEGLVIEEITVTAQKRSQSINDVPMAIAGFGAEQMSEMGINDTTDLANAVPGFNYSNTAFGPPVYTLRGIGFNESSPQASSTVGIYIDEIAVPFPIMTKGANIDLERVEILKGPQGTLYGRNATAGAVNYIAALPTEEFDAGIMSSYDDFKTLSVEGFVSGALGDKLGARVAIKSIQSSEGWQKSISRDEKLGEKDKLAARLTLAFEMSESSDALFRVSYNRDKSESLAPQAINYVAGKAGGAPFSAVLVEPTLTLATNPQLFPGNDNDNQAADWTEGRTPALDHESVSFTLAINHDLSDTMTLTSLTGYSEFKDRGSEYERGGFQGITAGDVRALGGGNDPFAGGVGDFTGFLRGTYAAAPDSEHITADYIFQDGSIDAFSQELRLTQISEDVVWIAGVYYSESEVQYDTLQDWGVSSNVNILPNDAFGFNKLQNSIVQKNTTFAVFANADWLLSDLWTLTTGVRYTDDKADYVGCTKDVDGGGAGTFVNFFGAAAVPGECITILDFLGDRQVGDVDDTLKEDSLSWRLALNYDVNEDTSVYASYSRGFKSGSFPSLAALADVQLQPVVQERLDAFEIGVKMDLLDNSMHVNASTFYYDYKNKQALTKAPVPVFGTAFTLANIPESTVFGFELDMQWLPVEGLTLAASLGYLDTEIDKGQEFNQVGQFIDLKGSPLPFAAELQTNVSARYEWGITDNMMGMVAIDISYSDEAHHDFESGLSETVFLANEFGADVDPAPYTFDKEFIGESYTLVNARIGLQDAAGQWKVYLWGRNLGNENYAQTTVKNNEMIARYAGMTRSYGLSLEYFWN